MATIHRVTSVLPVSDVQAAIDWYKHSLGFSATIIHNDAESDVPIYALLTTGQVEFHLCRRIEDDPTLCSPANCYLYVDGIEEIHARLIELNADMSDPVEMPWGNVEVQLHDPDGNRLILSQPES